MSTIEDTTRVISAFLMRTHSQIYIRVGARPLPVHSNHWKIISDAFAIKFVPSYHWTNISNWFFSPNSTPPDSWWFSHLDIM